MASTLRERRIRQELKLLGSLRQANPGALVNFEVAEEGDDMLARFTLRGTPLLTEDRTVLSEMVVTIRFARYYPLVPPEVFISPAPFHPNVSREDGFVCLFENYRIETGVIECLQILQRVTTWEIRNDHPEQVLWPEAVEWHEAGASGVSLPLPCVRLSLPPEDLARPSRVTSGPPVERLSRC